MKTQMKTQMKNITTKDISCLFDDRRPDKIDLGDGYYAVVSLPYDEDHGAPWDGSDCHGPRCARCSG